MKALPCFSSHEYNITTSKEHCQRLIISGLPSEKENGFAAQTKVKEYDVMSVSNIILVF